MSPLTVEQCEASHVHPYREPTEADIREELEQTPLGMALLEVLAKAYEVDLKSRRRETNASLNFRRNTFRSTPEECLAALIIDACGADDDCYLTRSVAATLSAKQWAA